MECSSEGFIEAVLPYISVCVVVPCYTSTLGLVTGGRKVREEGELHGEGDVVSAEVVAMTLSNGGHQAR